VNCTGCEPLNVSSSIFTCVGLASIPLGDMCGYTNSECAAPGVFCADHSFVNFQPFCYANATAAIGSPCNQAYTSNGIFYSDCVTGAQCSYNYSVFEYTCQTIAGSPSGPVVAVGQSCNFTDTCATNSSCFNLAAPANFCNANANCTCNLPLAVNQICSLTTQCGANLVCSSGNNTCVPIAGYPCSSPNDCGFGWPTWDCSCTTRTCYRLNTPTPAPLPTPAPPPTPPICFAQQNAWEAVAPVGFPDPPLPMTSSAWYTTATTAIPLVLQLPNATVKKLLSWICCYTCGVGAPFQTSPNGGYQLDCGALSLHLTTVAQCSTLTAQLAFLNCWPKSAAFTPSAYASVIVVVLAALWA